MNLINDEEVKNENNKTTKMIMMAIIALIVILVIASVVIIYLIMDVNKNTLKLNIDGKNTAFASDVFLFQDNETYISIKDFARLVGYEAYTGDHISEETTKCYIKNDNEEASFELNSNKIYKTVLTDTDNEYFNIEKPVIMKNNKLYVTEEGMEIASNTVIDYQAENMQITVYTLPTIIQSYVSTFPNSAVVDEKADYNNKKAVRYGMMVVMNNDKKYGVHSLEQGEIIGTKYKSIKFIESSQEFIVTTDDNKMGIMTATGKTKIQPVYDKIKQIDNNLKLYLVENAKLQGVINEYGNIVIHLEYEKIGIDTTQFTSNEIKNPYLLFDNCIPVNRDKKWGLFDKKGQRITQLEYDEFGCIAGTQSGKTNNNLLVIPKYEGIVVRKDKKYGIINSTGEELVPCVLDSVYSVTSAGQDSYYMVQGDKIIDVLEYIEKFVIQSEAREGYESNSNNETTEGTNEQPAEQTNQEGIDPYAGATDMGEPAVENQ